MKDLSMICVKTGPGSYSALVDEDNMVVNNFTLYPEFKSMLDEISEGDMFMLTTKNEPGTMIARADKIPYKESLRRVFEPADLPSRTDADSSRPTSPE